MRAHFPIILGETVWFGVGGMLNAWLPVSPGWIWAGVTIVGAIGLLVYYWSALAQLYLRVTKRNTAFAVAADPVSFHFRTSEPTVTLTRATVWTRIRNWIIRRKRLRATPVRGIAEIERCHKELVKYIRSQPPGPIGFEHVALWGEFQPHIVTVCRILDEQKIPYPEIDTSIIFVGTGEWRTFFARLLAVKDDVEKARLVYGQMQPRKDHGGSAS